MSVFRAGICGVLAVGFGWGLAVAQAPVNPPVLGGMALGQKPPTDAGMYFPAETLEAGFKEGLEKKLYAFRILEGGTYNINIRGQYAPEERARVHTTIHDLFFIQSGEGEMTTGGELVNVTKGGEGGVELSGDSIRNGVTRRVQPGDVVFAPAGVPHQVTKSNGELQMLLVRWFVHD